MRGWILQANPTGPWRIFDWWEQDDSPLASWTLSWPAPSMQPGDAFAVWVNGRHAGVYAVGKVTRAAAPAEEPEADGHWVDAPRRGRWQVLLATELYLFDAPIRRDDLAAEPDFASSLILRMPRARNPFPVEPPAWAALEAHLPRGVARRRASRRRSGRRGDVVVVERARGGVAPEPSRATPESERLRARLVDAHERALGRPLPVRTALLPGGDRLVSDAYDPVGDVLLAAAPTSSRRDVRTALGQLLDQQRHLAPSGQLAILLADPLDDDLASLLQAHHIAALVVR